VKTEANSINEIL